MSNGPFRLSKEMYAAPELEVVDLGGEDVICNSVTGDGTDSEFGGGDPGDPEGTPDKIPKIKCASSRLRRWCVGPVAPFALASRSGPGPSYLATRVRNPRLRNNKASRFLNLKSRSKELGGFVV